MKKNVKLRQNKLVKDIKDIILNARKTIAININHELILAYWNIGKLIIENETTNNFDAKSSRQIILELSKHLSKEVGKGFSRSNLFNMRKFYLTYPNIQTLSGQLTW